MVKKVETARAATAAARRLAMEEAEREHAAAKEQDRQRRAALADKTNEYVEKALASVMLQANKGESSVRCEFLASSPNDETFIASTKAAAEELRKEGFWVSLTRFHGISTDDSYSRSLDGTFRCALEISWR